MHNVFQIEAYFVDSEVSILEAQTLHIDTIVGFPFLLTLPQPADESMYQQMKPLMQTISGAGVQRLSL